MMWRFSWNGSRGQSSAKLTRLKDSFVAHNELCPLYLIGFESRRQRYFVRLKLRGEGWSHTDDALYRRPHAKFARFFAPIGKTLG